MAPKRKQEVCVQEEKDKAARLRMRATAVENKGLMAKIVQALKVRPGFIPSVCEHCQDIGAITEDDCVAESLAKAVKVEHEAGGGEGSVSTPPDNAAEEADGDEGDEIPRSDTRLSELKVTRLVTLLNGCETTLNSHRLKLCKPKAKRQMPKPPLLDLLEYMTGCPPDTFIGMEGPYKSMSVLSKAIQSLNIAWGRRCREIVLPPNWGAEGDGVYSFRVDTAGQEGDANRLRIFATHLFLEETARPEREIPASLGAFVTHVAQLAILKNLSERNAILCERGGKLRVNMSTIFPECTSGSGLESVPAEVLARAKEELPAEKAEADKAEPAALKTEGGPEDDASACSGMAPAVTPQGWAPRKDEASIKVKVEVGSKK